MDTFDKIRNGGQGGVSDDTTQLLLNGQSMPFYDMQQMPPQQQQFTVPDSASPMQPPMASIPPLPTQMPGGMYGEPKKSGGKAVLWIVLAVVAVLLIAGAACFYFLVIAKQCAFGGCDRERAGGSKYCEMHTCDEDGCYELAEDGRYCEEHQDALEDEEKEALGELVSFGWNSEYWDLRFELPKDTEFDDSSDEEGELFTLSTKSKSANGVSCTEEVSLTVEQTEDSVKSYLKEYNEDGEFVLDSVDFCGEKWTRLSNGEDGKALYKDGVRLARKKGNFVCMICYTGSVDETAYVTPSPLLDGCFSAYDEKPDQACLTTKATTTTKAPTTQPPAPSLDTPVVMYNGSKIGYAIIGPDKNNLRIRIGPGTTYSQLDGGPSKQKTYFGKNDKITIVGEAMDSSGNLWYVVDYPWTMNNGATGRYAYVYAAYVTFTKPS